MLRRLARAAAGEDGQRAQRRPCVLGEKVPAPLHDRVQRAVTLRHVPRTAAQQREPVAEAPGDLRNRQDPHPCRGQLDGERQPVEVAAQLGHRARRQLHPAPGGPGPLREQLGRGVGPELRQCVHRLRCEPQRGPAGGEHPHVVGGGDQGPYEGRCAPDDLLAVVEDQQRGPGAQRAEDAGHRIGGGVAADGGMPPVARAERGCHLRGHVLVRRDTGERHEIHHALLGPAADGVREPGLAEAAGADDGDGAGEAQQPLHRRDVLVPAEERIRLVGHAVPDHRRLAAQQLLLDGLEPGARIRAELVAQLAAVRLVPHERGGRARLRRFAAQQLGEQLLVARMLRGGKGQRTRRLRVPAQPGERERLRAYERAADGSALGAQRGHGVVGVAGLVGGAAPQREPGFCRGQRSGVVPGPGPVRARGGVQQQGGTVDLILGQGEPVSGRRARQDVGAQLRPRPRHEDLHRLPRPLRQFGRPQPRHQPLGAASRTQVAREQREQAAEPGRCDLLSAIGDTRQQGQVGGHRCRLRASRSQRPYRPDPACPK